MKETLEEKDQDKHFPFASSLLGPEIWDRILGDTPGEKISAEILPEKTAERMRALGISDFFCDLVRVEGSLRALESREPQTLPGVDHLTVNPTLQLFKVNWSNLPEILTAQADILTSEKREGFVLIWQDPRNGETKIRTASCEDFLALKIVREGIDPERAAEEGKVPFAKIKSILDYAIEAGILLRPPSHLAPFGSLLLH